MMTNIIAILKQIGMYMGFVAVVTIGVLHRVTPTHRDKQSQQAVETKADSINQDSIDMIKTLGKWLVNDLIQAGQGNSLKFNIDIVDSIVHRISADSAENIRYRDLIQSESLYRKQEYDWAEKGNACKTQKVRDLMMIQANTMMDKADSIKTLITNFKRDTSSTFYLIPEIILDLDSMSYRYTNVVLNHHRVTRGGSPTFYAR